MPLGRLITILDVIGLEASVPEAPRGTGRPPEDRRDLARAFVAKAVPGIPTTSALFAWDRRGDQLAGAGDVVGADAACEQAVMANAVKSFWQDMDEEAADELVDREPHDLLPRVAIDAVILRA